MPLDQIVTHIKPQGINSICKEYILQMFTFENTMKEAHNLTHE